MRSINDPCLRASTLLVWYNGLWLSRLTHSATLEAHPFLPIPSVNSGRCLYPPPLVTPANLIKAFSILSHVSSFSPKANIAVNASSSACRCCGVGHCWSAENGCVIKRDYWQVSLPLGRLEPSCGMMVEAWGDVNRRWPLLIARDVIYSIQVWWW
jgi:hypothetical protein